MKITVLFRVEIQRREKIKTAPLASDEEATGCAGSAGARLASLTASDGRFVVSWFSSFSAVPNIVNTFHAKG